MRSIQYIIIVFIFILSFCSDNQAYAQSSYSFLKSGKWAKIKISNSGVYKITYETLKKIGIDRLEEIVVAGYGGSFSDMINKKDIPDIALMPLFCNNGEDGKFGKGDYYLFYAKGPEDIFFNNQSGEFIHKKNQYEDFATYFVGYGNITNKEIRLIDNSSETSFIDVHDCDYFIYHEKSIRNLLKSGRNQVGEKFSSTVQYSFNINIPDIIPDDKMIIKTSLLARGVTDSDFEIFFNGNHLGDYTCDKVNVTSFSAPFADNKVFKSETSGAESNILKIRFKREGGNVGWLDYFTVQARRRLRLHEGELLFSDSKTANTNTLVRFNIHSKADIKVWDITDLNDVTELKVTHNSELSYAIANTDKFRRYIAFDPSFNFQEPEFIGEVNNSNLHGISDVDMLIVTPDEFKEEAERLADFHNEEGVITKVVLAEDVYNEFSSGQKHPIGIRDFVRNTYLKSEDAEKRLKYLCLFGDGSYDAKKSLLATWQTSNFLEPSNSFVSDDFYGLLEEGEGESLGNLDIGVGRIPVNTNEEAAIVVDKIIAYKESKRGNWITRLAFVADDGDYNEHVSNTDNIAEMIIKNNSSYRVEKLYMDAFTKQAEFDKLYYPEVNRELNRLINDGLFICNYIGHGNENGLAHEKILTEEDIDKWKNKEKMPLFITATCDFSRFDDHDKTSVGEKIFLKENGGAIALLSTTRLVYSSPNFILNKEFFRHVFAKKEDGKHYRLGDLIRITKNSTGIGNNIRNFSLIGDPALLLNYPENEIKMLSISDTIKANGKVKIEGEICFEEGDRDDDFDGIADIVVFDKQDNLTTLGNDSKPFQYSDRKNIVFNGSVSVRNGYFLCEFPVSADINKNIGSGKVYFYAYNDFSDAYGCSDTIPVGGKSLEFEKDNTGPIIDMFINNDKFRYGGITDSSPLLFARLNDKNGINTGGYQEAHNIVATLDGNISIVLNHNYISDIDDFSRGTVWYRFSDLSEGIHSVTLDVWDNFNNHSRKEISFRVKNEKNNVIKSLLNVPNPAKEYTDFYFEHNMPDQEFTGTIKIYNLSGQLVKIIRLDGVDLGYRYGPFRWNLDNESGGKVKRGIYIAELLLKNIKGKVIKTSQKVVVTSY